MPSDNIDRAIKKGTGQLEGITYEDITLEGYGPGGVAVYIEGVSDNKNRTTAEVLNCHVGYSEEGLRSLKKTLCNYAEYRFFLFELGDNT